MGNWFPVGRQYDEKLFEAGWHTERMAAGYSLLNYLIIDFEFVVQMNPILSLYVMV